MPLHFDSAWEGEYAMEGLVCRVACTGSKGLTYATHYRQLFVLAWGCRVTILTHHEWDLHVIVNRSHFYIFTFS